MGRGGEQEVRRVVNVKGKREGVAMVVCVHGFLLMSAGVYKGRRAKEKEGGMPYLSLPYPDSELGR